MPLDTPTPLDDQEEWARLIDGLDHAAILVAIRHMMSERVAALFMPEDVWQETLAMAWAERSRQEWQGRRKYRALLLQMARNRVRDAADQASALKRGGGRRTDPFSVLVKGVDGSPSSFLPGRSSTPSRAAHVREQAARIESALRSLPEDLRSVVRLRLLEEEPMQSVAKRLGIAKSTAQQRLLRGAKLFREQLAEAVTREQG